MKRLISWVTTITIVITMAMTGLSGIQQVMASDDVREETSRDILTMSWTDTFYDPYGADVTVYYTVRRESSNSSGQLITGILYAEGSNPGSGWYAVDSSVSIYQTPIFGNNYQKAYVPVCYRVSSGSGWITKYDVVIINLLS